MTKTKPCNPCDVLRRYLASEGALSITELRVLVGAKQDDQVRHWRDGVRRPKPKTAVRMERVTGGRVPRCVWYPDDWQEIWPELAQSTASAQASSQEASHG